MSASTSASPLSDLSGVPTLIPSGGNIQSEVGAYVQAHLDEIQKLGFFRVYVTPNFIAECADAIRAQYARKDELTFNPNTYWGYQKRANVQQEIICLTDDEVKDDAYRYIIEIASGTMRHLGSPKCRKSPVFWRYDPENLEGDAELGFDVHEDFSLLGITFQCTPGLFWVQSDGTEVDMSVDDGDYILVTFGAPSAEFGFTPFKHGVKRVIGTSRLAGGVFVDIISDEGDDGVAQNMEEFDSRK
jgi:hypothetical protein